MAAQSEAADAKAAVARAEAAVARAEAEVQDAKAEVQDAKAAVAQHGFQFLPMYTSAQEMYACAQATLQSSHAMLKEALERLPDLQAAETVNSPSKDALIKLLREKALNRGSSKDEVVTWVEGLPISRETKGFLRKHLFSVEDAMYLGKSVVAMSALPGIFRRLDYKAVLEKQAKAKVLVLSGRRRQGKTCALPMELLHARKDSSGVQDKVMFYDSGEEKLLDSVSINTVILVLTYARIPSCWDEFQCSVENLGRAFKFLLEPLAGDIDPLSVIMWGSSEPQVQEKAGPLVSGLKSRGAYPFHLPDPSIEVLVGMYYLSKDLYQQESPSSKELLANWDSEEFLSRFSVCGYALESYVELGTKKVTVADYERILVEGIGGYGKYQQAVLKLINDQGSVNKVASDERMVLLQRNIIRTHPQFPQKVIFLNPEVLVASILKSYALPLTRENVCDVERRVFELLVRGKHLLLPHLLRVIDKKLDLKLGKEQFDEFLEMAENMRFDTFGATVELDGFFRFGSRVFILGVKRCLRQQSREGSIKQLDNLSKKLKLENKGTAAPGWELVDKNTTDVVVVEVSAIKDGEGPHDNPTPQALDKLVTFISVCLEELVESVSPEFVRFEHCFEDLF